MMSGWRNTYGAKFQFLRNPESAHVNCGTDRWPQQTKENRSAQRAEQPSK